MSERIFIETKAAVDDTGAIEATAWPYSQADRVKDVIRKGAVSLETPTLPILFAHDHKQVVGVWESITDQGDALQLKGRLLVHEIPRAAEVHAMVKSGAVSGVSIGFEIHKATRMKSGGRDIASLSLHEASLVAVPMHRGARVTSIKGAEVKRMTDATVETTQDGGDVDVSAMVNKALAAAEQKAAERLDRIEAKLNRPVAKSGDEQKDIERKAFDSYLRTGSDIEVKAAASDSAVDGGWLVLPTIDASIRELMTDISPMRQLAEVVTIGTDVYERFYSLGKRGAQWVAERSDRPQDTARPELIKHSYGVAELYAAPATTRQLLDDASVDAAGWLIRNATHDFAETEGESFLRGDGVLNKPKGLLTYDTTNEKDFVRAWGKFQYVPAGHASAPTDANLIAALPKLVAALRVPYKSGARFVMNSNTAVRLRGVVDANGRYLWAPTGNLIEGLEHPLLGYPVTIDDGFDDIGAGACPVAFGDFSQGYVVVDRHGIRTEIDRVTQKGKILFDTYKRVGGGAGDFNAIKFLKISAT